MVRVQLGSFTQCLRFSSTNILACVQATGERWADQTDEDTIADADEPEADTAVDDDVQTRTVGDTLYKSALTFEQLNLSPQLLEGLYTEMKFSQPSRIQGITLPLILNPPNRSLIAQAHNGSGKTTCFVLAMLSRVDESIPRTQALCVCPTRELVVQNLEVTRLMGKHTNITATSTANEVELPRGQRLNEHIVIGAHGRLKNLLGKRQLDVSAIKILVFDEADIMLERDGFAADSLRMVREVKKGKSEANKVQILLFSATFADDIKAFAQDVIGEQANEVFLKKEQLSLEVIKQCRVRCNKGEDKFTVLKDMILPNCENLGQTIVFVRTRENARHLHRMMEGLGFSCTSISSELDKGTRDQVIKEFREGTTRVLISTDVLSRGFDVQQVSLVINYYPPVHRDNRLAAFETYLHRIGRSGRFGRKGAAFNLCTGQTENAVLDEIADYFKIEIPEIPWDDEDKFKDLLVEAGLAEQEGQ